MISYTLKRSRRKTIGIYIREDAALEVRAPLTATKADIDRFVAGKLGWIERHLAAIRERAAEKDAYVFGYGSSVPYLGNEKSIRPKEGAKAGLDDEGFFAPPGLPEARLRTAAEQVLKLAAKSAITERVNRFASIMGLYPSSVKVNGAKTRWGSCSSSGSLNFSFRLVMTGGGLIDYVVVHELAHIKEHNHSARFWAIVAGVIPDYKARRDKLKETQLKLSAMGWF